MSYYGNCNRLVEDIISTGLYYKLIELNCKFKADLLTFFGNLLCDEKAYNFAPYLLLNKSNFLTRFLE